MPPTSTRFRALRATLTALALSVCAVAQAYSVSAGRIHDDAGNVVTLRGVNWFGFETELLAPHGLWSRNMGDMLDQMRTLGFNALRVPLCPATLRGQPVNGIDYARNPALQGLNSLQVLDAMVDQMEQRGMYFLLDHHRPDCQAISELWYTSGYSESQWIADLAFIADRYKARKYFLGVDLKNEPHGSATWGSGNAATDWNLAAEKAGRAVLARAPNALIFVEGISQTGYCTNSTANAWWGGNLGPQSCKPLDLPGNRLVLSPHVYGPDVFAQPYFSAPDFPANMPAIWDAHFGSMAAAGYSVAVGETGGKYGAGDARDKTFQQSLFKYLKQRGITDVFYWSWNPNSGDTGGILNDDWTTVREDKMALLRDFWSGGTNPPPPPPPPPPLPPPTDVKLTKTNDWGAGYCANVDVTNSRPTSWAWSVSVTVEGHVSQAWNAVWSQSGTQLVASGVSWNATLAPLATAQFGFCANR